MRNRNEKQMEQICKNKKFCVSGTEAAIEDKLILNYKDNFINHYSSTVFETKTDLKGLRTANPFGENRKSIYLAAALANKKNVLRESCLKTKIVQSKKSCSGFQDRTIFALKI